MVTSAAFSGVSTSSLKPESEALTCLYSGKILPACLINQTGILSTFSPFAARNSRSFFKIMLQNYTIMALFMFLKAINNWKKFKLHLGFH
jgi:hypothetical protein